MRATFDCSDAGAVSSCTGATDGGAPITSGGLLDTTKPGPHTFIVTGVDLAGHTTNRSISYIVKFVFPGFQSPVDNPPVINVDNAGRTIPVKWALRDAAGRALRESERSAVDLVEGDQVPERHHRRDRATTCPSGSPASS